MVGNLDSGISAGGVIIGITSKRLADHAVGISDVYGNTIVATHNVIGIPISRPPANQSQRRGGDDPPGLGADAGDNIRIHPVAREQRYAGEIQDFFIRNKSFVGGHRRQRERPAEGCIKIGEHAPLRIGPVQNAVGVAVNDVVGLENPGVGGAAPEGNVGLRGIRAVNRGVRTGNQVVAGIIQLVGETVGIGHQIVGAGVTGVDAPVVDDVVDEIEAEVVAQTRVGAVIVGVKIVVKAQRAGPVTQPRAEAMRVVRFKKAVGHDGPLHGDIGRIQHRHQVIRAPGGGDVIGNYIHHVCEL